MVDEIQLVEVKLTSSLGSSGRLMICEYLHVDKARPCHVAILDGTFLDTCRNLGGCVVHGTDSYATIGTMTKVV